MKLCFVCKVIKAKDLFYVDKQKIDGRAYCCKECKERIRKQNYYHRERNTRLVKTYNITNQDFSKMLEAQNDCCAICKRHKSEFKHNLHVDHDHITGKVRQLLCTNCNTHLGFYEKHKDNIDLYLKENK